MSLVPLTSTPCQTPFEVNRVLDPKLVIHLLDAALRRLGALFPAFRTAIVRQCWAGLIDAMPEAIPVISGVGRLPGFFMATGFPGVGLGSGRRRAG